jgi:TonB family protein
MKKIGIMFLFIAIGLFSFAQNETEQDKKLKEEPSYVGGQQSMMEFIANNIKYPEEDLDSGASGTVFTQLLINDEGKVIEVEILRGVSKTMDLEAIRVIEAMPKWNPGKDLNGNPVKTTVTLPIRFALN